MNVTRASQVIYDTPVTLSGLGTLRYNCDDWGLFTSVEFKDSATHYYHTRVGEITTPGPYAGALPSENTMVNQLWLISYSHLESLPSNAISYAPVHLYCCNIGEASSPGPLKWARQAHSINTSSE